jgi:arsenate reductase
VPDSVHNVFFNGNSTCAIMAEAILNRHCAGNFRAFSSRTDPNCKFHRHTVTLLHNEGYNVDDLRPKSALDFARPHAPDLHFVFIVCDDVAGEPCPAWPCQPITAHWGIPEPCAAAGSEAEIAVAFDETFGMVKRCIDLFLAMPIVKLDRLALILHLKEIGRGEGTTAVAKAVHGC